MNAFAGMVTRAQTVASILTNVCQIPALLLIANALMVLIHTRVSVTMVTLDQSALLTSTSVALPRALTADVSTTSTLTRAYVSLDSPVTSARPTLMNAARIRAHLSCASIP